MFFFISQCFFSSFGPKPGAWPQLRVTQHYLVLQPHESSLVEFEIDSGPPLVLEEEDGMEEEADHRLLSTTIDILCQERTWVVEVHGIRRDVVRKSLLSVGKKEEEKEEEEEVVVGIFEEGLVFDVKEGEV